VFSILIKPPYFPRSIQLQRVEHMFTSLMCFLRTQPTTYQSTFQHCTATATTAAVVTLGFCLASTFPAIITSQMSFWPKQRMMKYSVLPLAACKTYWNWLLIFSKVSLKISDTFYKPQANSAVCNSNIIYNTNNGNCNLLRSISSQTVSEDNRSQWERAVLWLPLHALTSLAGWQEQHL